MDYSLSCSSTLFQGVKPWPACCTHPGLPHWRSFATMSPWQQSRQPLHSRTPVTSLFKYHKKKKICTMGKYFRGSLEKIPIHMYLSTVSIFFWGDSSVEFSQGWYCECWFVTLTLSILFGGYYMFIHVHCIFKWTTNHWNRTLRNQPAISNPSIWRIILLSNWLV